jgi:PAS domain S-box-containing protein
VFVISLCIVEAVLILWLLVNRARRRQAEEILREGEAQLAGIIGSAMDAIVSIDGNQRIVLFNSAAEKIFGCSSREARGQPLDRFIPQRFREELEANIRAFGQTDVTGRSMGLPMALFGRRAFGEEFPIEAVLSQLELKGQKLYTIILRDITERHQAEKALRQSEERFRNLADTAPVMIWISDTNELCTYINQQWLDFTGRSMEQELGNGWAEGIYEDDYARCRETYSSAFQRRVPFKMEYRLRCADGLIRWVYDNGAPRFTSDGEFLGYIGCCIDISNRKDVEAALQSALEKVSQLTNQLQEENIYLQEEIKLGHNFDEIIGQSEAIKYVLYKIEQVAPTDSTVLIMGETGTGKELVARAIHSTGRRKDRALVKVDCAALSASLIESELFGHEKGAFTGAAARKIGRFELATGATIFLDEIGELPLELQVKLLRVIQEGEFERLGSSKTIKADVRIITATNRNLAVEVQKGRFREDLWYRLNVFPITVPPLKQRREDIPQLIEHFVTIYSRKLGKEITSVAPATLAALQEYSWPGNVRELANVIERAVINTQGTVLRIVDQLEESITKEPSLSRKTLEELEREYIICILRDTDWRIEGPSGAARILGLNPSTLRARMAKLGIQRPNLNFVTAAEKR